MTDPFSVIDNAVSFYLQLNITSGFLKQEQLWLLKCSLTFSINSFNYLSDGLNYKSESISIRVLIQNLTYKYFFPSCILIIQAFQFSTSN